MRKCRICGKESLTNHMKQYHKTLTEYNKTGAYEAKTRAELKKEIKKQTDFINIASMENPMNMGPENEKLEALKSELADLGESFELEGKKYEDEELDYKIGESDEPFVSKKNMAKMFKYANNMEDGKDYDDDDDGMSEWNALGASLAKKSKKELDDMGVVMIPDFSKESRRRANEYGAAIHGSWDQGGNFFGIQNMTRDDYEGTVYWKGEPVEHYDHDYFAEDGFEQKMESDARALAKQCEDLESRGIKPTMSAILSGESRRKGREVNIERGDSSMTIDGKQVIKIWESMSGWYWYAIEDQGSYVGQGADGHDVQAHAWYGYVQGFENEWGTWDSNELENSGVWTVPKSNWGWTGKESYTSEKEEEKDEDGMTDTDYMNKLGSMLYGKFGKMSNKDREANGVWFGDAQGMGESYAKEEDPEWVERARRNINGKLRSIGMDENLSDEENEKILMDYIDSQMGKGGKIGGSGFGNLLGSGYGESRRRAGEGVKYQFEIKSNNPNVNIDDLMRQYNGTKNGNLIEIYGERAYNFEQKLKQFADLEYQIVGVTDVPTTDDGYIVDSQHKDYNKDDWSNEGLANEVEQAEVSDYLDALRESGVTNMFGAGTYVQSEFGLSEREARKFVLHWMKNFGKEVDDEEDKPMSKFASSLQDMFMDTIKKPKSKEANTGDADTQKFFKDNDDGTITQIEEDKIERSRDATDWVVLNETRAHESQTDCPHCGGEGSYEFMHYGSQTCPMCQGTGKVDRDESDSYMDNRNSGSRPSDLSYGDDDGYIDGSDVPTSGIYESRATEGKFSALLKDAKANQDLYGSFNFDPSLHVDADVYTELINQGVSDDEIYDYVQTLSLDVNKQGQFMKDNYGESRAREDYMDKERDRTSKNLASITGMDPNLSDEENEKILEDYMDSQESRAREEVDPVKCDDCGADYASQYVLDHHKKISHGESHECPDCGDKFDDDAEYKDHGRAHEFYRGTK